MSETEGPTDPLRHAGRDTRGLTQHSAHLCSRSIFGHPCSCADDVFPSRRGVEVLAAVDFRTLHLPRRSEQILRWTNKTIGTRSVADDSFPVDANPVVFIFIYIIVPHTSLAPLVSRVELKAQLHTRHNAKRRRLRLAQATRVYYLHRGVITDGVHTNRCRSEEEDGTLC
jgi:hypothetical protein